ncbi:MAG: 50S ribosome-binding GTPase [Acidobacteriia bacterium]|nr:50S ribosome-binding GTPase [Terriglobia bacterium]
MPANLTPQYLAAEQRFKDAVSLDEKLEALKEMMAVIPKHKGTEKLQADLKRKFAKLQTEGEKKHGASKVSSLYTVIREGAGQVVLLGAPNVGKSSILARLTNATPEIGDYPFTTRMPQPGMMPFENIQIQIVDMPAIAPEIYHPWMGNIVRQADDTFLVVDLSSDDLLDEVDTVLQLLKSSHLELVNALPPKSESGSSLTCCRTMILANKFDSVAASENLKILQEFFGSQFEILPVSTVSGEGLEALRQRIFQRLDIIRIYTKVPGKKPDLTGAPFVLKSGSTVLDLARTVHREFEQTLKFAKVWSSEKSKRSLKFDGQMVERTHRLEDGDILELHG